jgi:fatty-acyl-CoA synthase
MNVTATFKYTKNDFVRQGYDPNATTDAIYFNARERGEFVRLDGTLHDCIHSGQIRP